MGSHLFMWIPAHRAGWFPKTAEDIVSPIFVKRFSLASNEIEEAAKCYSAGRYTACVFHLSRATEAGIKAVGISLAVKKDHELIERTLKFIEEQTKLNPANQVLTWRTHGTFFANLAGDIRAIARAWRNKVCHLVDSYTEERAKEILDVTPVFFRHMSEKIDQDGNLY